MDISQVRGTIHLICAFSSLYFVFILWFKGKSRLTFHLGLAALFSALYAFTYGGEYFLKDKLFWARATWLGVLILPAYITFLYYFIEKTRYLKLKSFMWYLPAAIIVCLALFTPYFIENITPEYPYLETAGPLEPLGWAYVFIGGIIVLFYLLKEYFKSFGARKLQIKYFTLGMSIYIIGGTTFAGILPLISQKFVPYIDISVVFSIFWVGLTTYAIFKKELFEIRIILTEILIGIIGLILLIQVFVSGTFQGRLFGIVVFLLFCFVGYLLTKATYRELKAKEILEQKVEERTRELRGSKEEIERSYEEIKKRKEDLEKFYKLTVGRELRMVELKKKIKELEEKLGQKSFE